MSEFLHNTLYQFNDWWFGIAGPGGLIAFGALCSFLTAVIYHDLPRWWRMVKSSRAYMHVPPTPFPWWLRE